MNVNVDASQFKKGVFVVVTLVHAVCMVTTAQ